MKSLIVWFIIVIFGSNLFAQEIVSNPENTKIKTSLNANDYATFGQKFEPIKVMTNKQMLKKYKNLKQGDTIAVKFAAKINSVCKKKGCWMNLDLNGTGESFVKFKDYGFFMPLNADGSIAIVNGKAFIDVVSVDELRHYAKDAKKTDDEINKITKPEITYAFIADGVLLKK